MADDAPICVVDDDEAVRESVAFLLQSDGWPVCKYKTAEEFLAAMPTNCACIVTDVRMPGMDGVALLRRLKEKPHAPRVIVITGHGDVQLAVAAMKEGAADFLQKPFADEALINAVRASVEPKADAKDDAHARLEELSVREKEVLQGLLNGKANKVIAYDLGISARTVEIYRANVMTKMQADSFAELVRLALRAGMAPD
ncbi:response regulator [Escherichia coli]